MSQEGYSLGSRPRNEPVVVGQYKLGKTLGHGSFGKVKLGSHVLTGDEVAVKIIIKNRLSANAHLTRQVEREIRILKLLNHPHIVRLYDIIDTPDAFYLIMEIAEGGELFDYILSKNRLPEDEARKFFRQIVGAVDYCHNRHVTHRDLKPENLLLDRENSVKIIDFGLSNTFKSGALLETHCGSPSYAAPELVNQEMYSGRSSDVWSLGVILYALITGSLPFGGENTKQLFAAIRRGVYRIPSYVSDGAAFVISRMLVVDPQVRATMEEVAQFPWVNEGHSESPLDIETSEVTCENEVDSEVLDRLVTFGYKSDEVVSCLLDGQHNEITACYYLLVDRKTRVGKLNTPRDSPAPATPSDSPAPKTSSPRPRSQTTSASSPTPTGSPRRRPPGSVTKPTSATGKTTSSRTSASKTATSSSSARSSASRPSSRNASPRNPSPRAATPSQSPRSNASSDRERTTRTPSRTSSRNSSSATKKTSSSSSSSRPRSRTAGTSGSAEGSDQIREIKGSFSVRTTSTKSPDSVFRELQRVLLLNNVRYTHVSKWVIRCETDARHEHGASRGEHGLVFELEICRIALLEMTGILFKRLQGETIVYQEFSNRLIALMKV